MKPPPVAVFLSVAQRPGNMEETARPALSKKNKIDELNTCKPLCLICGKVPNVRRHQESKHACFSAAFLPGFSVRKAKMATPRSSHSATEITAASLRVTWELTKKSKPFCYHCSFYLINIINVCLLTGLWHPAILQKLY